MCRITKLAHYVAGFLSALFPLHLSILAVILFLAYELIEYIKYHDTVVLDIKEYAIGFYTGAIINTVILK